MHYSRGTAQAMKTTPGLKDMLKGLLAASAILLALFLIQTLVAAVLVEHETARVGFEPEGQRATGFMMSASVIVSAPMCIWLIFIALKTPSSAGVKTHITFESPGVPSIVLWIGAYLVFQFSAAALFHMIGKPPSEPIVYAASTVLSFPLFLLASSLVAPLFEEIMFRGFLLGHLDKALGPLRASLISSAIWAMVHFQYTPVEKGYIFLFGMLLCAARYRGKTLLTPVIIHSFNNAVSVLLVSYAMGQQ